MSVTSIGDGSFAAGTRLAIAAADGGASDGVVDELRPGDRVMTPTGPAVLRHVTTRVVAAGRGGALPVRVQAGALGDGLPRRDMVLPAEQLLYVRDAAIPDGALVVLGTLVNAATIRREQPTAERTWYRLELDGGGVVIAEGLAVAARSDATAPPFALTLAAAPIAALRARLAAFGGEAVVAEPVVVSPAPVAEEVAPPVVVAGEGVPALVLVASGQIVPPEATSSETNWHFIIPPGVTLLELISPTGVPANTAEANRATAPRFGVAVRSLLLGEMLLALDGPNLGGGFHKLEVAGPQRWRWTTGHATLLLDPSPHPRRLAVGLTDWHKMLHRMG